MLYFYIDDLNIFNNYYYIDRTTNIILITIYSIFLSSTICLIRWFNFNTTQFRIRVLERWVWTTNHKRIGILYIYFGIFNGFLAILLSMVMRLELTFPGDQVLFGKYQF